VRKAFRVQLDIQARKVCRVYKVLSVLQDMSVRKGFRALRVYKVLQALLVHLSILKALFQHLQTYQAIPALIPVKSVMVTSLRIPGIYGYGMVIPGTM
jgi:hypothetical protein